MALMELGVIAVLTLSLGSGVEPDPGRLYGRVSTTDGDVLEGYLRWDRNEASWTDFLDGAKAIPAEHLREAERLDPVFALARRKERSIEALGVRITWDEDDGELSTSPSSLRFGHIESLTPMGRREARLRLRSGGEVVLTSTSTDLGSSMRRLVIEEVQRGEMELRWREIERIDFREAPAGGPSPRAERLHGTVTTWDDVEFTGNIAWDLDEILLTDVLDGREGREDHEISFDRIAAIEWESDRSARVILNSGEELVLRGTNDVDRSNRGIEISARFGRAIVQWEDFRGVRFHAQAEPVTLDAFGHVGQLVGSVEALDGRSISGEVRWDNDEAAGWEVLDGWSGGAELNIELGAIHSIERIDEDGVTVTLFDGSTFDLSDSSDVAEGHRGVFVKPVARPRRLVRWQDFHRVVFAR